MHSVDSYVSKATQNVQSVISKIASRNGDATKTLTSLLDEEAVSQVWSAFGLYLSRQLRMGRGVLVKNFGTFSFSAPDVVLDGVTNPLQRDKQARQPVFLVAKEYVKGRNLKTAIVQSGGRQLRPYQCQTSGSIQQTIINFAEIAVYSQQSKDSAKIAIDRVLKAVSDMARSRESVEIEIPGIGTLLIRNDMAAVSFYENLVSQCRGITKRPVSERKLRGDMKLNASYLNRLPLNMDDRKLSNTLGIEMEDQQNVEDHRPKTAKFPSQSFLRKNTFNQRSEMNTIDRPQTSGGNKTSFLREVSDQAYSMERLKYYIRDNALNFEDAFLDICNNAFGRTSERKIKLSQADFTRAIKKIDLPLSDAQIIVLFDQIDSNSDGYIDRLDWMKVLPNQKTHINYIKDVVFRYQLHTDDLLQRMNLNRDHPPLSLMQLREALQHLDESLNSIKALKVAKDILGNKESITITELVTLFDTVEEDDKQYEASWFKDTLHRLRNHLITNNKFQKLKESFEFFDEHQEGNLDTANFKTVIMENNVGLSVQDINRLVRYIPKIRGSLIDYYGFLKMTEDVNKRADSNNVAKDLVDFAQKVGKYIKAKRISVATFMQKVKTSTSNITPEAMAQFVQQNIFTALNVSQCLQFCQEMDLDYDGILSEEDIETFIKRYAYFDHRKQNQEVQSLLQTVVRQDNGDAFSNFEQTVINSKSIDLLTIGQKKMFETLVNGMKDQQVKTLNPIAPLTEEKFDHILKDLRVKLQHKGLSFEDFFNLLDVNHNGFITITDFSENVGQVMNLSQPAKDGFFSFIDKKQIGLIDLNTFLRAISKSIVQKMPDVEEDNFDWELEILFKIRNWQKRENLTVEDAFRTMDRDFDGEISKSDIKLFIIEFFKVEEQVLTAAKINRIFKLMDQFKRGRITLMDFRRFIEEGVFYGQNKQIFGDPNKDKNKSLNTSTAKVQADIRSSFDWKANARQQIGLVISRHFPSVKQSYDIISGYRKKLVFAKFKKWIDDQNVLAGFDLTEKLLYELFSDIDQHKKGFLTEQDWTNSFGHFHWLEQMMREVIEACKNFHSNQDAVNFFSDGNQITRESFTEAIYSLFPKRFQDSDINTLWNKVQKQNMLSPQQFLQIFGDKSSTYVEVNKQVPEGPVEKRNHSNVTLIDRIRRFLRISKLSLVDMFKQYDTDQVGRVTNLEFRQIMRSINMGLTIQEIDQLCSICQSDANSMFDWKEFLKMLQLRQADHKIVDRASIHLAHINDHIYNYLISPKDAFRQYDKEHQGYLTFQRFQELIETLFRLAREEVPPFAIIKDLFEFIDKRRDDQIDLSEWMDTFALYPNPNQQRKRPATANVRRTNQKKSNVSASERKPLNTGINFYGSQTPNNQTTFAGIADDGLLNAESKFKGFLRKPPRPRDMLQYNDNGTWESSLEFDRIITTIGKNRKYLLDIFKQISQNGQIPLSEANIKEEIDRMLRSQGITIQEDQWPSLLAWSIKNGRIDYKFLLSVYKDRLAGMDTQPRIEAK